MILSFLILSAGFYFVTRLQLFFSKFFLNLTLNRQKIFIIKLILFGCLLFFFHKNQILMWSLVFLIMIFSSAMKKHCKLFLERRLQDVALEFIDQCCLSTASGISFRNSLQRAFSQRNDWFSQQFKLMVQNIIFSNQNFAEINSFMGQFRNELVRIDQSGHKINEQLKGLRRVLKIEINFRRKSRQILRNLRIQAASLAILYICFVLFLSTQIDLLKYKKILILSIILFLSGFILTFTAGRRIQWKV